MAYKVTFSDGGTDAAFWGMLEGYTVEINGDDYVVEGYGGFSMELNSVIVDVRKWDDEEGAGVGPTLHLGLADDAAIVVY